MKKKLLIILSGLILAGLIIWVILYGNKKSKTDTPSRATKHYLADTTIVVKQTDLFDFSFSDTTHYYTGNIDDQNFIIKVNQAERDKISGVYFLLSQNNYAKPMPFELYYTPNNYQLFFGSNSISLSFEVTISERELEGSYIVHGISHSKKRPIKLSVLEVHPFTLYKSNRYKESSFEVEVAKNIIYGKAEGFWISYPQKDERYITLLRNTSGKNKREKMLDLNLDIYKPHGDSIAKHPLIVFFHGGGFYVGDKCDLPIQSWCDHFARLGYITASVNYRLGFKVSKSSIQRCGYKAIQDAHAALRFLVANAEQYGIDTSAIFIAGTSAGSITGMSLLFMNNENRPKNSHKKLFAKDLGGIETSGNDLDNQFKIRGIANMWGAVYDLSEIEDCPTPIISFHGTKDQLVPYDEGLPFSDINNLAGEILFDKMYGSAAIHRKLDALHIRNELYPLEGKNHGPHIDNNQHLTADFYFIQNKIENFFYKELVPPTTIENSAADPQLYVVKDPNISTINWKVEGGFIIENRGNSVKVIWNLNAPTHKITVSGLRKNGTNFFNQENIKMVVA